MLKKSSEVALRTAFLYAAISAAWILFSDDLMVGWTTDLKSIRGFSQMKGLAFVVVSATWLCLVLRRQLWRFEHESACRKKAEQEKLIADTKFNLHAERAPFAMFVGDGSGRCIDFNPAALALFGYDAETMRRIRLPDIVAAEHLGHALHHFDILKRRGHIETDCRVKRSDGTLVWVSFRGVKISDNCYIAYCQDITERKGQEREIERLSRIRETLGEVNQMIVRATSPEELFQDLCRIVAEYAGFKLVWVGLLDRETKEVRLVAHQGAGEGFLKEIKIYADERPEGLGPTGTCIREGRSCIFNDYFMNPLSWPWREAAVEHGIQAIASMPLRLNGRILGAFTVCASEVDPFQDKEISLLEELAMDVSYALANLEQQEQRQQAELALRQSETLLRETGRIAKVGGWQLDPVTRKVHWTEENYRIHELDPDEELTWERIWGLFSEENRARLEEACEHVISTRNSFDLELELKTGKGNQKWIRMIGSPLVEEGRVVHLRGSVQDITERKRAEESLRLQSAALEAAANAIMITDKNGNIEWANSAFTAITGYALSDAVGKTPRILKSGNHGRDFYKELWSTIVSGNVWHGELVNQRKDDGLYTEETTITPVRDQSGEITHFVAIKQDITARKKLEEQYRQSQKMEAIGTLAGGVAHDFNNLLAIILMQTEMLAMEENISERQAESLRDIIRAARRAADLTRQLLMFSRKNVMQSAKIDLNEIVANVTRMLGRIVGEDVRLELSCTGEPAIVKADPGMMEQVLMNLAVNARDAMPKGGRIAIETSLVEMDETTAAASEQARSGSFVCLSVTDTGEGIAPDVLPRIFEPFFTTKDVGKGTGLGLATVFGIVEQHQGWIDVGSVVGVGTTFRIFIPRLVGEEAIKADMVTTGPMRGGNETILLVEDETALRYIVKQVLIHLGYTILEATTGREALDVWRRNRDAVQLVVTDLVMPDGMNGKDMADELRKESPDLKLIYISGYSTEVVGRDFPREERANFLAKPFEAHKLAQLIRARLDGTNGSRPAGYKRNGALAGVT